jgi:hypothetical protein
MLKNIKFKIELFFLFVQFGSNYWDAFISAIKTKK